MTTVQMPIKHVLHNVTLTVKVTGLRVYRWRLRLGLAVMRVGILIIGCRPEIIWEGRPHVVVDDDVWRSE